MSPELGATGAATDPFSAFGPPAERINVAAHLRRQAERAPDRLAVKVARSGSPRIPFLSRGAEEMRLTATFAELEEESDGIARGLADEGLGRGDRVCLFVRPGVELVAVTYALYKLGAVPVLIDPGMGRKNLLACVRKIAPRALIGVPTAHLARVVFSRSFESVEILVTVGRRMGWGGHTLAEITRPRGATFPICDTAADDPAAVLFTSGSTGPPKGVLYTHGIFDAQLSALQSMYGLREGEVDVACFPLFGLFDAALGITAVFPELDPSRPGSCDPARIAAALEENRATFSFGSPAIWRRVVPWCIDHGIRFEHLERALIAGAPVQPELIEAFHRILPLSADVHTPYGATEALPVASLDGRELVSKLRGRVEGGDGTCVGRVAPGIDLRLIRITDEPIAEWSRALEVPEGELGEIVVRGPVVTPRYEREPDANARSKIATRGEPGIWHRMGDVGYRDADGLLWFCGRKAHRIESEQGLVMPVPVENVYNTHPRVRRTALVGVGARGSQKSVLVVQPEEGSMPRGSAARHQMAHDVLRHGDSRAHLSGVASCLFRSRFPVDVRHNAKIDREELARWAETKRR